MSTVRDVILEARSRVVRGEAYNYNAWSICAVGNLHIAATGSQPRTTQLEPGFQDPAFETVMESVNWALGYGHAGSRVDPLSNKAAVIHPAEGPMQVARERAIRAYDEVLAVLDEAHDVELPS